MHLRPDELVDLAEGARAESSAPHLAVCEVCRGTLADLRATMGDIAPSDVPDPSPLFWNELSARVRESVAVEAIPRPFWRDLFAWPRVLVPMSALAAAAVVIVAMSVGSRTTRPALPIAATEHLLDAQQIAEDPSLGLVADLTAEMDWDTAREAGLAPRGSAEHAVTHLSAGELRELGRILHEELANSGG